MSVIDELAQANGFDDAKEMNRLISKVNIRTPGNLAKFTDWRDNDGSKAGLLNLLNAQAAERQSQHNLTMMDQRDRETLDETPDEPAAAASNGDGEARDE